MAGTGSALKSLLSDVLNDFGGRLSIDGSSRILVSDTNIAIDLHEATKSVRTPYGPTITVAGQGREDASKVKDIADIKPLNDLQMDYYTHSFFGVAQEDPKFVLQGLKHMVYALRPKGIAVLMALRLETKETEGEQFQVSLEDKMKYQSKGKIEALTDVVYYAGFERGKIRSFDRTTEVDGQKTDAEVVLAMKWDQLTG